MRRKFEGWRHTESTLQSLDAKCRRGSPAAQRRSRHRYVDHPPHDPQHCLSGNPGCLFLAVPVRVTVLRTVEFPTCVGSAAAAVAVARAGGGGVGCLTLLFSLPYAYVALTAWTCLFRPFEFSQTSGAQQNSWLSFFFVSMLMCSVAGAQRPRKNPSERFVVLWCVCR